MAVNPQLKEYVDQQVKLGVSNDVIKTALLGAGWRESDINEVMNLLPSSGVGAAKPAEIKPVEVKISSQEKPPPVSFVTSDIFQPKNEPVFESKGTAPQASFPGNKPQIIPTAGGAGPESGSGFFKKPIVPITLGVLVLLFAALAGFFYIQNNGLQTKITSLTEENASLTVKLNSSATDKKGFTDQIVSLNQTAADLNNQLSIFAVPSGTSTAELSIDIKGTLGGGGKSLYSLTTNKAIVVYVKNSKDTRVDSTLKPLLGNQVEISGTHAAGSNSITVTSVNGQAPALLQSTNTSAVKAATSTGTNQ